MKKTILITGSTDGIGKLAATKLAKDGHLVCIHGRNPHKVERTLKEIKSYSNNDHVQAFIGDLSSFSSTRALIAEVKYKLDSLDVLINNAAVQYTPTFLDADFDYASIEREVAINFTAVCRLTSRLLPKLLGSQPAAIVNVNSGLALTPKTSSAVYCATKGAMNLFSQSLGYQLAETNVSVLQAFLPLVDTGMTEGRGNGKMSAPEAAERLIDGIERDIKNHDIGKVKILRLLLAVAPWLARRIMRQG